MRRRPLALLSCAAVALAGCTTPSAPVGTAGAATATSATGTSTVTGPSAVASTPGDAGTPSAPAASAASSVPDPGAPPTPPDELSVAEARARIFVDDAAAVAAGADACSGERERVAAIRCLHDKAWSGSPATRAEADALLALTGGVVGLEPAQHMEGGWRGPIELVPEAPVGRHLRHLEWIVDANRDFVRFFDKLEARAGKKVGYRYRGVAYRFTRSVGKATPSAYAYDWQVAYNVTGSLHWSGDAVRETLFHEIFHLNDAAHGDWSPRALSAIYEGIMARCTKRPTGPPEHACLTPYAPGSTTVRGGTYYAFTPGNGVMEYGAELALRYYREQRAALGMHPAGGKPFKCGPSENGVAWRALVDEFFGGVDFTAPCP
ncbi:MAG: hypothetical protein HY908_36255 [Myxococcales bacterium]|nr:hypothetical protein [Myxococcales bacterium]